MDEIKRAPAEWEPICNIKVFDPDGWDRKNYAESWAEFLTESEFRHRAARSTCMPFDAYQAWGK